MGLNTVEFTADKYDIEAKQIYDAIRNGELTPYPNDWGTDPIHGVDELEFFKWAKQKGLIKQRW